MSKFIQLSEDCIIDMEKVCGIIKTPAHTNHLEGIYHPVHIEIFTVDGKRYEDDGEMADRTWGLFRDDALPVYFISPEPPK